MDLRILEDLGGAFLGNSGAQSSTASGLTSVEKTISDKLSIITDPLKEILGAGSGGTDSQASVASGVTTGTAPASSSKGKAPGSIAADAAGVLHWLTMPIVVIVLGLAAIGGWLAFGHRRK